jgi:hypothetical protein
MAEAIILGLNVHGKVKFPEVNEVLEGNVG